MIRNLGIGVLIVSFGFSSVGVAQATEIVDVPPVIVQPAEVQSLNQQVLDQDRQNRDEEIAIKKLIEENNELTQTTLASQEDQGLAKINQTMLSYRDSLLSRDRARIVANGEKWWTSRYGDLIALTEDADAMTVHQDLEVKSGMLAEKYQMLTDLKDEMTDLNEKLQDQQEDKLNQKEATIDGFKKIAQEQQDKIQMLVDKLGGMDQKIAQLDDIIAQKDRQIAHLKENLSTVQNEVSLKDETIRVQESQIAILQAQSKEIPSPSSNKVELPPINVNFSNNKQQAQVQAGQAAPSSPNRVELAPIVVVNAPSQPQTQPLNSQGPKDEIIKQQENQIVVLKAQLQDLSSKEKSIKSQVEQINTAVAIPPVIVQPVSLSQEGQSAVYSNIQAEVTTIKDKMKQQDLDLKAKDETIRWLNQVVAATKDKAEYFKLTARQEMLSMQQVQGEIQKIKDDFASRFKNYDQFENDIASLKNQVSQLGLQLSQKQTQVDSLKAELTDKTNEENTQSQKDLQVQQDLKAQLQDKENQIVKMKADVLAILQDRANKEIYLHNASAQADDRLKLAKQLIDLQQQEASLLDEKSQLALQQYDIFDRHFDAFEKRMKTLLAEHQFQTADLKNSVEELKGELDQKEQQVELLKTTLENKIAEQKDQTVLEEQIQDLKAQLQDKEDQINTMKTEIQSNQEAGGQVDTLKQRLADQQYKAGLLKQELESKNAQSQQMTLVLQGYQKNLESKGSAYNEQLRQVLLAKNDQAQMEEQIADLSARLQEKEAQVVKIRQDMYDLQELTGAKEKELQTKDLNLSIVQQKMMSEKINEDQDKINQLQATNDGQLQELRELKTELALARQQLSGMPSSDEIEFLRTGLDKATTQLKQKDAMLLSIKASADEYAKEFKEQTQEFQSVKEQLQNAFDEINHKNEDLKYKNLALIRLKERSTVREGDLEDQIKLLTQKLELTDKRSMGKNNGYTVLALEKMLKTDNQMIKNLQLQLKQLTSTTKGDTVQEKLKQALDKIDEQGRVINLLVQKLQEAGKNVDLTHITANQ